MRTISTILVRHWARGPCLSEICPRRSRLRESDLGISWLLGYLLLWDEQLGCGDKTAASLPRRPTELIPWPCSVRGNDSCVVERGGCCSLAYLSEHIRCMLHAAYSFGEICERGFMRSDPREPQPPPPQDSESVKMERQPVGLASRCLVCSSFLITKIFAAVLASFAPKSLWEGKPQLGKCPTRLACGRSLD